MFISTRLVTVTTFETFRTLIDIDLQPILGTLSTEASQNAGAFLIKAMELQQAIEQSTRDYKIFWAWLNSVIMRLMDEPVPDDIAAFSQQDIIYLTEFLSNFDIFDEGGKQRSFLGK